MVWCVWKAQDSSKRTVIQLLIDMRYVDVSCHAASSMSCIDTFGMYNNMAATAHTHRLEKLNTPDKQLVTVSMLHFVY